MRHDGDSAGIIVVSFVLGVITGGVMALLLAPSSGEETRQKLADRAREGRERASGAARQGREFLTKQKDVVAAAVERGRQAYDQARGAATPSGTAGGETL